MRTSVAALVLSGAVAAAALPPGAAAAAPAPAATVVKVTVDAARTIRTVDGRIFGANATVWDPYLATPETAAMLAAAGVRTLRFPGGSLSDEYHWRSNTTLANTWAWATGFDAFAPMAAALGASVYVTVNYGTGTPEEAAAWVTAANVEGRHGFRYWEVGNECYGTWETDAQAVPHDPYTYAVRSRDYIAAMKAADATVEVGVVVTTGEDAYVNTVAHPARNPRTGRYHYGWTPVVLATLRSLGVTPDFVVYHRYEQGPGAESDAALLLSARSWPADAADLRRQLADYLGEAGAGVEIAVTENNSVWAQPGKQTTSVVNGLFLADAVGSVLQTEIAAFLWWDVRNGQEHGNNNDGSLYGWREYGDYGIIATPSEGGSASPYEPYPTYRAFELLAGWAGDGDSVVAAASDHPLLSVYAVRRTSGALALLAINTSPSATLDATIALAGFVPGPTASVRSWGIPQDEAARTGVGSSELSRSTVAVPASGLVLPCSPYTATVVTFPPATRPLRRPIRALP